MIHKVLVTPIIGLPQVNGWAQVTQSTDGNFICAFSIEGSQAGNVGRDLVDLINNNSPESATSVYSLMKRIVRFAFEKDCRVQVSSAFLNNGKTIFSAYNGSLLLKRNGKVGTLLKADADIKIIEGQRIDEDIFVILTNPSLEFKGEIFQKLSQGLDADTTVASIVPGVQNLPDSSLVAMAFISDLPDDVLVEKRFMDAEEEEAKPVFELSDDDVDNDSQSINLDPKPIIEASTGKNKIKFDKQKLINLLQLILKYLKKIGRIIWVIVFSLFKKLRQLFTNEVYVDEKTRVIKKKIRVVVIVFLVLLILSVPLFWLRWQSANHLREAQVAVAEAMDSFVQAQEKIDDNPIEAREEITIVIDKLKAQEKLFEKKKSGQKYISAKISEVGDFYNSISGKEVFNQLEVFYDFQLIESDFIANGVDLFENQAFFLDKDKKKVIKLGLDNKKVETFNIGGDISVKDFSLDGENLIILADGVYSQGVDSNQAEKIIDSGKSNEEAKIISIFNDNIYVLNSEQRNIFKYSYLSEEDEFSDPVRWVKSAKALEFDQVISMAVDGDIWLSTKQGQIFKLSSGNSEEIVINGLVDPLNGPTHLFTQPDYKNVYLLEPSSSRLIVADKEGNFVKEVKSVSLASASNLVADETNKKVLVISGSLVFEVGL